MREYSSGEEKPLVDSLFVRRSFSKTYKASISLTSATKTEIKTNISAIEFIHLYISGDSANVSVFKGNSPESWEFDNTFLTFSVDSISSVSLQSDADTTVEVFLGGS
jgi:hypothetical protein